MKRFSAVDSAYPGAVNAGRAFPELFAVDVRSVEGETVLTLHGELDLSSQLLFASALAGAADESVARIVLDLSDLTFIDCGSIGLIYQARIRAGLRGIHLELRDPNPNLLRVMKLTGLLPAANGEQISPIVLPLPSRAYERAVV